MQEIEEDEKEQSDNQQDENADGKTVFMCEQSPEKTAREYDFYEYEGVDLTLTGINERWVCDMLYNEKTERKQFEFKRDDGVGIEILEMPEEATKEEDEVERWAVASLDVDCPYYSGFQSDMMYSDSIWRAVQTVRIITVNIAHLDADELEKMKDAGLHN